jgi:hypothetical protein
MKTKMQVDFDGLCFVCGTLFAKDKNISCISFQSLVLLAVDYYLVGLVAHQSLSISQKGRVSVYIVCMLMKYDGWRSELSLPWGKRSIFIFHTSLGKFCFLWEWNERRSR